MAEYLIMSITATLKKNYLRYLKYSLVGIFIFIITEFLTFLLYPRFPDIFAVLIALIISTVIGYFLGKKYVANVKTGKFLLYFFSSIWTIIFMDLFQWFLLIHYNLNPLTGNIIAGIIISPVNYAIHMLKVWGVSIIA